MSCTPMVMLDGGWGWLLIESSSFFWKALISVSCSWLGPRCIDWSAHWGVRTSGPDKTLLETFEKEIIKHRSKYECVYTRCITHVITHIQITWKHRSTYARILQHFTYVAPTAVWFWFFRHPSSVYLHSLLFTIPGFVKLAAQGTNRAFYIHSVQACIM